jgi:glycosyltransferase involved in cell wall biosynthesis
MSVKNLCIAYLTSRYPAISHTFILHEIHSLQQLGVEIRAASINAPDRPHSELTQLEQQQAATTFYIKLAGIWGALRAHTAILFSQPKAYLRGLGYALRLGKLDLGKLLYNFFYFVEAVMLGHWMQQQQLKHLHVHFGTEVATVGLFAKQIFPITLSLTIHGPDEFYNVKAYYLAEKIRAADFICCISHYARSQLMILSEPSHWEKFEVSRLGVDASTFIPRTAAPAAEVLEIICVGRLVPVKGQFILLQAVQNLLQQGYKLRLRFVGDGPSRALLQQTVNAQNLTQQVIFEGAVNHERILALYAKADIFALASFAEGLPVVLMEAMIMQIPCVTTQITGIPELIGAGEGVLVAASDTAGLTEALAKLLDDATLRENMGKLGREKVLEQYDLKNNVAKLAHIFERRLAALGKTA